MFRELSRLLLPLQCAGCAAFDVVLCERCAALWERKATRVEAAVPRWDRCDGEPLPPIWALAAYTGAVRRTVVAWKDRGRTDLDRFLAGALAGAVPPLPPGLLVVPMPSTAASRRTRGRDQLAPLVRAVCAVAQAEPAPALRRARGRDQVGLGSRSRSGNVRVALRRNVSGANCLLLDDVATTGATLAAARRALEIGGAQVVGALVLAATPRPFADPTATL